MQLNEAITALEARLGLPTLQPAPDGRYSVVFDGELAVDIVPGENATILLEAAVGPLPDGSFEAEALLKKVLQWNFVRLKSQQETLTLEPDSQAILLHRRISGMFLSENSLPDHLEAFVNSLEFWHNAVRDTPLERRGGLPFLFP